MKGELFFGIGTALVTPFSDREIDYGALERLIERQIEAKVGAIIIGGTTGEASTLERGERGELYRRARDIIGGRTKLILGTGSNSTREATERTREAERIGCDGVLVVTPYYNKGTVEGVYQHYKMIANSTDLPIILYNVPSRTGVNMPISTVERLADIENIVGIKEAAADSERLRQLRGINGLKLYTGCDQETLEVLKLGGDGSISVISNLCPAYMTKITELYASGRLSEAEEMMKKITPLIDAMFIETNPAPIKHALAYVGLCKEEMRLPMMEVRAENAKMIEEMLRRLSDLR